MNETYEKWQPVEGITDDFISAEIAGEFPDLYIRLIVSVTHGTSMRYLRRRHRLR